MKTLKSILPVFVLLLCIKVNAQGPTLGFQSGGLYSITGYDGQSMTGQGYYFGVSGIFPLAERWTVRPEVNFQQRSFKTEDSYSYNEPDHTYKENYTMKTKLMYLDLPVLIQFQTNNRFGLYFGPQYGTAINSSYTSEYTVVGEDLSTGEIYEEEGSYSGDDYTEDLKEISFVAGMNYSLNFGLSIDFRAQRSLIVADYGDIDSDLSFTNFQLGLRYNLPIGKK